MYVDIYPKNTAGKQLLLFFEKEFIIAISKLKQMFWQVI